MSKKTRPYFMNWENSYFEGKGGSFLVSDRTLKSTDNGVFMFIWFTAKINIEDNNIFLCSTRQYNMCERNFAEPMFQNT